MRRLRKIEFKTRVFLTWLPACINTTSCLFNLSWNRQKKLTLIKNKDITNSVFVSTEHWRKNAMESQHQTTTLELGNLSYSLKDVTFFSQKLLWVLSLERLYCFWLSCFYPFTYSITLKLIHHGIWTSCFFIISTHLFAFNSIPHLFLGSTLLL